MSQPPSLFSPLRIRRLIRVVGLQRSGNHALISWLLSLTDGSVAFFNDTSPEAPFRKAMAEGSPDEHDYELVVYSIEDRSIGTVAAAGCSPESVAARWLPDCAIDYFHDILLIRDPFNCFASRIQSPRVPGFHSAYKTGLSISQLYLDHLREFSGNSGYPKKMPEDTLKIDFSRWLAEAEVRVEIADSLSLPLEAAVELPETLSEFGGGSSFDSSDTAPHLSDLNSRWEQFKEDRDYLDLFRNPELIQLALSSLRLDADLKEWASRCLPKDYCRTAQWRDVLALRIVAPFISFLRQQSNSLRRF